MNGFFTGKLTGVGLKSILHAGDEKLFMIGIRFPYRYLTILLGAGWVEGQSAWIRISTTDEHRWTQMSPLKKTFSANSR